MSDSGSGVLLMPKSDRRWGSLFAELGSQFGEVRLAPQKGVDNRRIEMGATGRVHPTASVEQRG